MTSSAGLKILESRKVDIASKLSERAQAIFRSDSAVDLIGATASSPPGWGRAVKAFAAAAVACGLAASITMAPTPVQAQQAPQESAAASVPAPQRYVSLANMKFLDLVQIRDQIGLDETTVRDYGMARLDQAQVAQMGDGDRKLLVGGLYWAAETLDGFDRTMAENRSIRAQTGQPALTRSEEVQGWQKWLDSRVDQKLQERQSARPRLVVPSAAAQPVDLDPIALQNTIERVQTVLQASAATSTERQRAYPAERP
ncbi:hypothetical protein [Achromobacter sp. DH1f]|uniref:hypothetical protein n=1 Tax=Achromobacter sp. DH1f TaxID=1397275 RepID=UPI0004680DEE|nr:hypothetical protein [Achromobacter sp. DH1f]